MKDVCVMILLCIMYMMQNTHKLKPFNGCLSSLLLTFLTLAALTRYKTDGPAPVYTHRTDSQIITITKLFPSATTVT